MALDTTVPDIQVLPADVLQRIYSGVDNPLSKPINYIDPTPKPFKVQVSLVEYFERIKRLKADKWQIHFCNYLQEAVVNRHINPTWAEFHAQAQLGKTVVLSQIFPAWCFGHDPLFRYVLAMYNISRSEAHSEVIIQIMRSQLHREIFTNMDGHLPSSVSKAGWMTNARRDVKSGTMDAQKSLNPVGLESGMTGSGFDWLTIDDPYKEPKDAFSETMYDNLARFWEYGVKPRISLHACVGAMFHRYSYDDFGGYLLNTGKFDYVRYSAIADGDYIHDETGQRFTDPLNRQDGELISPDRFPHNYYADKQGDAKMFMSMFQGRPGREEGDFFNVEKIQIITDPIQCAQEWANCSLKARGWDIAATEGAGDRSAAVLEGLQPDGTLIIADVYSEQVDSAKRVADQQSLAEKDGRDVAVVIPEELAAAGKSVVFFTEQALQGFTVVPRRVTNAAPGSTAKMRRAYNLSIAVNSGKVKFLVGEWNDRLKRLMRRFGSSISGDDEIDGASDAYNYLYEEFHKGLVIKDFSEKNIQSWTDFGHEKIPEHWTVYVGLKILPEANTPNAGVIIARAAANSGLKDTLFIVDVYKEYTADFYQLFTWLESSLEKYCEKPKAVSIKLHKDSESYLPTIQQKLKLPVSLFKEGISAGIAETNWYCQLNEQGSPRLYGLVNEQQDLSILKQEALSWGHNDKGVPTAIGSIWDCMRMVAYSFRTRTVPLTEKEKIDNLIPTKVKEAYAAATTGADKLAAGLQYNFERRLAMDVIKSPDERFLEEFE